MSINNHAIVVNWTGDEADFGIGSGSTGLIPNGTSKIVKGVVQETVSVSGPKGSGEVSGLTFAAVFNSWTIFIFTSNGLCNIFSSGNVNSIHLEE